MGLRDYNVNESDECIYSPKISPCDKHPTSNVQEISREVSIEGDDQDKMSKQDERGQR